MNAASSRSHLVVTVHVSTLNRQTGQACRGKLAFVDLAGSERLKKSGSEGQALKEAAAINGSLSALGDVISALTSSSSSSSDPKNAASSSSSSSEGGSSHNPSQQQQHVPYRNSKLTMLMADCLGGCAKALMVVAVAPTAADLGETAAALGWAARARGVVNSKGGAAAAAARTTRDCVCPEIARLRRLVETWQARAGVPEAERGWVGDVEWADVEDVRGGGDLIDG